jgi:MinD-like ATPase involved in chromosome partitioning or flagellar assembly
MSAYVVSCYSYKGGTGRTTGAANIAYRLALLGTQVCLVDLDVEAPGLLAVLGLEEENCSSFVQQVLSGQESAMQDFVREAVVDVGRILDLGLPPQTALNFVPASSKLKEGAVVKWRGWQPVKLLRWLLSEVEAQYGTEVFVLDIASGLRNSSIVPMAVSDLLLVFFRWSRQHLRGTIQSIRWLEEFRASPDVPIEAEHLLIPSAIPSIDAQDPQSEVLQIVYDAAKRRLADAANLAFEEIDALRIAEDPVLKWDERILRKTGAGSDSYDRIAQAVLERRADKRQAGGPS